MTAARRAVRAAKWVPALFITACSWYLSSREQIAPLREPGSGGLDKPVHLICFAGLAFWVAFALNGTGHDGAANDAQTSAQKRGRAFRTAGAAALPALITSLYGAIDELHQHFVPTRTASVRDWLADTAGAALGALAFWAAARLWALVRRRTRNAPVR